MTAFFVSRGVSSHNILWYDKKIPVFSAKKPTGQTVVTGGKL
jgi:hypothetical protein